VEAALTEHAFYNANPNGEMSGLHYVHRRTYSSKLAVVFFKIKKERQTIYRFLKRSQLLFYLHF